MQRTTVRLPDDLLEQAKDCARLTGRTLTQLLEGAVRSELARAPTTAYARVAERSVRYSARNDPGSERSDHEYSTPAQRPIAPHLSEQLHAQVADIQAFLSTIPDRDARTLDEILGYDANGLPG